MHIKDVNSTFVFVSDGLFVCLKYGVIATLPDDI